MNQSYLRNAAETLLSNKTDAKIINLIFNGFMIATLIPEEMLKITSWNL